MTYLTMNGLETIDKVELISSGVLMTMEDVVKVLVKHQADTASVYLYNAEGSLDIRVKDKKVQVVLWEPTGLIKALMYMVDTVDDSVLAQWVVSPLVSGAKYEDMNRMLVYIKARIKGDI